MTLFNPVFNRQTPKGVERLKTQTDEGLTPADEAGSVVLRQPPASKLANLFRIDVRDHALGLVTQQLGGRVTEHPPGGWLGPRTPSLREGPGSASVPSGSPDPVAGTGAPARPCGRGKLAQFSLLQRFAVWWVAPPWPILSVAAVLLALCRLVDKKEGQLPQPINPVIIRGFDVPACASPAGPPITSLDSDPCSIRVSSVAQGSLASLLSFSLVLVFGKGDKVRTDNASLTFFRQRIA